MPKLIMLSGNARAAREHAGKPIPVVSQTFEDGHEMTLLGRQAMLDGVAYYDKATLLTEDLLFFCNHDDYFNGLRLAVSVDRTIPHDNFEVRFFDKGGNMETIYINAKGRVTNWPDGFFDANLKALAELARRGK